MTATPVKLVVEEKVPQPDPEQLEPVADQFTPELSLVVAVIDSVWLMVMPTFCRETETVVVPEAFTVRLHVADLVCGVELESVTLKASDVPLAVAVGVPLMTPVEVFSVRPAGRVPLVSDQV